jgi:hypothetical protein
MKYGLTGINRPKVCIFRPYNYSRLFAFIRGWVARIGTFAVFQRFAAQLCSLKRWPGLIDSSPLGKKACTTFAAGG